MFGGRNHDSNQSCHQSSSADDAVIADTSGGEVLPNFLISSTRPLINFIEYRWIQKTFIYVTSSSMCQTEEGRRRPPGSKSWGVVQLSLISQTLLSVNLIVSSLQSFCPLLRDEVVLKAFSKSLCSLPSRMISGLTGQRENTFRICEHRKWTIRTNVKCFESIRE